MKGFYFGVDYYPEHWPKTRWQTDVKLMKDLGVDVVRMAEFSWSKLEPRKDEYNFGWLDEAIELLASQGIKTILCTPSAAPPAWIIRETPDIQPTDIEGRRRYFGGRHHNCQSHPVYREHIQRYVTAFGAHFGKNPNIIGWQIDNELGNSHADLCTCPYCESRFRLWLQAKYCNIETLNRKWGNAFWSQEYRCFDEIQAPKITVAGRNPSAILDWRRFCSDLIVDFHQFQSVILRKNAPEKFITHNMMGFADKVNYYDLGADLDFVSSDSYPVIFMGKQNSPKYARVAAESDLMRCIKDKNFWMMEQQSGITGWEILGRAPKPGQLGIWAVQAIAHGADTVVFFRWRTCAMGTEQYWHGILPHSGIPGRNYTELKEMIAEMRPVMAEVQGTVPKPEAGIVFSYDQEYGIQIQPHHPDLSYTEQVLIYHMAFYKKNIPVDIISEQTDFSKYKLLIAPIQYILSPTLADKYEKYVKSGGNLVLTMRSGVKDESNLCVTKLPLPGLLGKVLGLEIPEYDCLRDTSVQVSWKGEKYTAEKWSDIITLTGAEMLAQFSSEFYSGYPAITKNQYGNGRAFYVGTEPTEDLIDRLIKELADELTIASLGKTPDGVEITARGGYVFVINHTEQIQKISVPASWEPIVFHNADTIAPYAYHVYKDKAYFIL